MSSKVLFCILFFSISLCLSKEAGKSTSESLMDKFNKGKTLIASLASKEALKDQIKKLIPDQKIKETLKSSFASMKSTFAEIKKKYSSRIEKLVAKPYPDYDVNQMLLGKNADKRNIRGLKLLN